MRKKWIKCANWKFLVSYECSMTKKKMERKKRIVWWCFSAPFSSFYRRTWEPKTPPAQTPQFITNSLSNSSFFFFRRFLFFLSIYFSFFFLPRETNSFSRISMSKFEVWSSFLTFKQTAGDRWSFFITLFSFSGWSLVIPSIGSKNQTNSRWERGKEKWPKKDAASVEVRTRDVWKTNRRYLSIDRSFFDLPLMKTEVHLSSPKYLVVKLNLHTSSFFPINQMVTGKKEEQKQFSPLIRIVIRGV